MNTFIITGVQRSGTTLLSVMLGKHPDVLMERRVLLFRLLTCLNDSYDLRSSNLEYGALDFYKWLILNDKDGRLSELITEDVISVSKTTRDIVNRGIFQRLKNNNKKVWGDKAPNAQFYIKDIALHMPTTKVLHIVRDGRATAASMSSRSSRNLRYCAQHWVDGNVQGLVNEEVMGTDNYKIIKYEDLLMYPERTMQGVCAFLNIPFDPKILSPNREAIDTASYVQSELLLSRIDHWKSVLNPKQLMMVERIQSPLLHKLGYEVIYADIKEKYVSYFGMACYQLWDSFRGIFVWERMGMKDQKQVVIKSSLGSRLTFFVRTFVQLLFSDRIYKGLHFRIKRKKKKV